MKFETTVSSYELLDEVNKNINKDVPQDGKKREYNLFFRLKFRTTITKSETETDEDCYKMLEETTTVTTLKDAARKYGLSQAVIDTINKSMLEDMIVFIQ